MAKIDEIDIGNRKIVCLNISKTVGASGTNKIGDVLVVQALLNYIANQNEDKALILLGTPLDEVPEISGEFDIATFNAIATFKHIWIHRLLNPTDSVIHPAHYKGRVLRQYKTGRLMTITLLSQLADFASRQAYGIPYTDHILHVYPRIWTEIENDLGFLDE
jgi:hypothetical protein